MLYPVFDCIHDMASRNRVIQITLYMMQVSDHLPADVSVF